MIKHITLIAFKEGTTAAQIKSVEDAFKTLPEHISAINSFQVGQDLGLLEGNAGLAVIGEFENKEDFLVYAAHQAHTDVIYPVCGDVMAGYSTAQFEC